MRKLSRLGIIGVAAVLTGAPFSLQWSQDHVPLSLSRVSAQEEPPPTAANTARVHRRVHRRTYHRAACVGPAVGVAGYGYGSYYGYTSSHYAAYRAPKPYWSCYRPVSARVRAVYWPYPPHRYSYYLAPFASVSSTDAYLRGR